MYYLVIFFIFLFGSMIGYGVRLWIESETAYGGVILVQKQDEKLVYTLEIFDDPEQLQYEEQILFRVDSSDLSLDRK